MREVTLDDRISALFDEYDRRKNRISKGYDSRWDAATTAGEVLSANEWYEQEQEKLAEWWRKSLHRLSEQSKEGAI